MHLIPELKQNLRARDEPLKAMIRQLKKLIMSKYYWKINDIIGVTKLSLINFS